MKIKVTWPCDCEQNVTGHIDGDVVICDRCQGVIDTVAQLTLGDVSELERLAV